MKPFISGIILILFAACNKSSMRGIDDGLTVIGVILAIMIGAWYFIKKIWMTTRKDDREK